LAWKLVLELTMLEVNSLGSALTSDDPAIYVIALS